MVPPARQPLPVGPDSDVLELFIHEPVFSRLRALESGDDCVATVDAGRISIAMNGWSWSWDDDQQRVISGALLDEQLATVWLQDATGGLVCGFDIRSRAVVEVPDAWAGRQLRGIFAGAYVVEENGGGAFSVFNCQGSRLWTPISLGEGELVGVLVREGRYIVFELDSLGEWSLCCRTVEGDQVWSLPGLDVAGEPWRLLDFGPEGILLGSSGESVLVSPATGACQSLSGESVQWRCGRICPDGYVVGAREGQVTRIEVATGETESVDIPGEAEVVAWQGSSVVCALSSPSHPGYVANWPSLGDESPSFDFRWVSTRAPSPTGDIPVVLVHPSGDPRGCIVQLHGGPYVRDDCRYSSRVAALARLGFCVLKVNYRGSAGFGGDWAWPDDYEVGSSESEDVLSAIAWFLQSFPEAAGKGVVLHGVSWGGMVALLAAARADPSVPLRGVIADRPIADWVEAYEDETPELQEFDRLLFEGSPLENREAFQRASPSSYVDAYRVPIHLYGGRGDSRCSMRQLRSFERALVARGKPVSVWEDDAGHVIDEPSTRFRRFADQLRRIAEVLA